jgi:multiple sugar transport system permease protein
MSPSDTTASTRKINWGKVLSIILLVCYLSFALVPILWMFSMSLKNPLDVMAIPPKIFFVPTLENYARLLLGNQYSEYAVARTDFTKALFNTFIIAGGATILSVITGTLAAYALSRHRFAGRGDISFVILSFRFAPELTVILPLYVIYRTLHLYNTYLGLILIYQVISLPLIVWVIKGYFDSIPYDSEQAALIDGYSWWGSFTKICLPLAAPGIAATAVIAFIFCWNNFTFGLLLGARETMTLTVATSGFISYEQVLWGQMAAASVVTIIPVLIFAFLVQRWLVRGLTFGAVKG